MEMEQILPPRNKAAIYLPSKPTAKDLVPFLYRRLNTKRLRKKFLSEPKRYKTLFPKRLWEEWEQKRWWVLCEIMAGQILSMLNREGFARKIFVDPERI